MLTGRQSQMYYDRDIQYGVNYMAMTNGNLEVVPKPNTGLVATKAVSEIEGKVTNSQKELNNMLDKLMNDSKDGTIDYVATVGFMTINPPEKPGGHALTVKSVTSDTVTMINPWYPDKEVTMSRENFLKCARSLSITDLNKSQVPEAQVHQNQHQTGLTPQLNTAGFTTKSSSATCRTKFSGTANCATGSTNGSKWFTKPANTTDITANSTNCSTTNPTGT